MEPMTARSKVRRPTAAPLRHPRELKMRRNWENTKSGSIISLCRRTALKRCTKIDILWYRRLVSRASPEFSEILLPTSSMRWPADALKRPRSLPQLAQRCNEHRGRWISLRACCCTCLNSGSVNIWLSQWTRDSHVVTVLLNWKKRKLSTM